MFLDSISIENLLLLTEALREKDVWRRVAERLGVNPLIHVGDVSCFVTALMHRNKTVDELRHCLFDLHLYDALSYISEPERLHIMREPYCEESEDCFWDNDVLFVREGGKLHLKIDVLGSPTPSFQWLRDNVLISTERELIIQNFRKSMEGLYHCSLHQLVDYGKEEIVISEDVAVQIKIHNEPPRIIASIPSGKCEIEYGKDLVLSVTTSVGPEPQYAWWHGSELLVQSKTNVLQIPNVDEKCTGKYECHVKSQLGEDFKVFEVEVLPKKQLPSEKRALIITICNYVKPLTTPHNDGESLRECLERENFQCTILKDLSADAIEKNIREFFASLRKGAYVFFYFGGHGFIDKNSRYLVGCDRSYGEDDADKKGIVHEKFVHEQIFEEVQEYDPLFFVVILDMCQERLPSSCLEVRESNHQWQINAIWCYATSQNRQAFEEEGHKHSLYCQHLLDVLQNKRDLKFLDMIQEVHKRFQMKSSEQIPTLTTMGSSDFKLSDPISKKEYLMCTEDRNI